MAKKTTIAQPIEKKMRSQSKKTEAAALMPDEQQKKVSASAAKSTKKAKPKTVGTDKEKPRKSAAKKQPLAEKMTAPDPLPGKAHLVNPTVEPAKKAAASAKQKGEKKIFVLDTSVILYNHNSINSFEDNDIAIPITVLEELDQFKKGNDTINFEAR
ncbi:MAG: PIN domain-containing protein, partial [Bacteroidales bacterium]|nr:PIN domain-containing protein [Bacteroidales bacterium]